MRLFYRALLSPIMVMHVVHCFEIASAILEPSSVVQNRLLDQWLINLFSSTGDGHNGFHQLHNSFVAVNHG